MKLRHVRAAAIFGICVVALTGARGHHGGSCGGSSHSSSHSSSGGSTSGGSTTGGDSSSGTFGGTTSGGSTTGGTTGSGTSSGTTSGTTGDSSSGSSSVLGSSGGGSGSAMSDIKILSCSYSDRLGITAKVQATNSSATRYDYRLTVKFYGPDRALLATRNPSIPSVGPGKTDTLDVSTPYVPKPGTSGTVRCEIPTVTRTAASF